MVDIHPMVKSLGYHIEGIFIQRVVSGTSPTDVKNMQISLWNSKTQEIFWKDSYAV